MLADDIEWDDDGLSYDGSAAPAHEGLDHRVLDAVPLHEVSGSLVRGDVTYSRHHLEGRDPKPAVKTGGT